MDTPHGKAGSVLKNYLFLFAFNKTGKPTLYHVCIRNNNTRAIVGIVFKLRVISEYQLRICV